MTEQNFDSLGGDIQNQPADTQNVSTQQNEAPVRQERTFSESRVNEIVQQRTRETSQRAVERAKSEWESQQKQNMGMGGMQQQIPNEQDLRRMMQEEFTAQHSKQLEEYQRAHTQKQVNDLANEFMGKLSAAKERYPDLEKRRDELGDLAPLVPFINETDEAAGVVQHLLDNGHNVATLLVLAHQSPTFLRRELKKLATSIKTNDEATSRSYPREPLSDVTPSINTTMGNGSGSIEALKSQDWLRG